MQASTPRQALLRRRSARRPARRRTTLTRHCRLACRMASRCPMGPMVACRRCSSRGHRTTSAGHALGRGRHPHSKSVRPGWGGGGLAAGAQQAVVGAFAHAALLAVLHCYLLQYNSAFLDGVPCSLPTAIPPPHTHSDRPTYAACPPTHPPRPTPAGPPRSGPPRDPAVALAVALNKRITGAQFAQEVFDIVDKASSCCLPVALAAVAGSGVTIGRTTCRSCVAVASRLPKIAAPPTTPPSLQSHAAVTPALQPQHTPIKQEHSFFDTVCLATAMHKLATLRGAPNLHAQVGVWTLAGGWVGGWEE